MPRQNAVAVQNNFIKGLITEATALNFPENAATDADNCVFSLTGEITRRVGFDFENHNSTYTVDPTGQVAVTYLWKSAAGQGDISFVVAQIGTHLHFYRASDTALSGGKHATVIDLTTFTPSGGTSPATFECQFTAGNGLLFVTNPKLESFYVTYDSSGDSFSTTQITLQTRDFTGDLTDALAVDARPATNLAGISAAHNYNLRNQGWTTTNLTAWDTARSDMPSNTDVSWYYKNSSDAFDFSIVDNTFVGNSPAPKGHHIWTLYNIDRNSIVSGAVNETIPVDRVSTCAFFTGRVFYSGLNAPKRGSQIYFTQVIENPSQYGSCYQTNDPSSEQLFNLLPSDGGVIEIQDAGTILKMLPALNALIVFASNGVWAITGSQGAGFLATDYAITKISSITNISHTSFVDVEGIPYWWNLEGIYTITIDPQSNSMRVVNITRQTVDTFYNDITAANKQFARGTYDPILKTIVWGYRDATVNAFLDNYTFDKFLLFNTVTQAFYTWSVDTSLAKILSLVDVVGLGGAFVAQNVTDSSVNVTDSSVQVVVFAAANASVSSRIKYFTYDVIHGNVTFSEVSNETYMDWVAVDGTGMSYSSYFVTGYALRGQAIKEFQNNYVSFYSGATEDAAFIVRGLWNFGNSGNSGLWSTSQICRQTAANLKDYQSNKVKIRGRGLALQIRVDNYLNNPFNIVGWSAMQAMNAWL